jgi:hypothetical protein
MLSFYSLLLASMAVNWTDYQVQGDSRTWDKNFDGTQLNTLYHFNASDFLEMTVVFANVI